MCVTYVDERVGIDTIIRADVVVEDAVEAHEGESDAVMRVF